MMKQHAAAGKAFKSIMTFSFKGVTASHFIQGLYLCTQVCVCSLGLMVAVKEHWLCCDCCHWCHFVA